MSIIATERSREKEQILPRPRKNRRICARPRCTNFNPHERNGATINMTFDEHEVVRLIDYEDMTQVECARQMGVARTTIQAIYTNARKKLSTCIVEGRPLLIDGGDVEFCEKFNNSCAKSCCKRNNNTCTELSEGEDQ